MVTKTKSYFPYALLHVKRKHITLTYCFWQTLKVKIITAKLQVWVYCYNHLQIKMVQDLIVTTVFIAFPKNVFCQSISHIVHITANKRRGCPLNKSGLSLISRTAWVPLKMYADFELPLSKRFYRYRENPYSVHFGKKNYSSGSLHLINEGNIRERINRLVPVTTIFVCIWHWSFPSTPWVWLTDRRLHPLRTYSIMNTIHNIILYSFYNILSSYIIISYYIIIIL